MTAWPVTPSPATCSTASAISASMSRPPTGGRASSSPPRPASCPVRGGDGADLGRRWTPRPRRPARRRRCRTAGSVGGFQPSTGMPSVSSSSAVALTSRMRLGPRAHHHRRGAGDLRQVAGDVQALREAAVHPADAAGGHEPDAGRRGTPRASRRRWCAPSAPWTTQAAMSRAPTLRAVGPGGGEPLELGRARARPGSSPSTIADRGRHRPGRPDPLLGGPRPPARPAAAGEPVRDQGGLQRHHRPAAAAPPPPRPEPAGRTSRHRSHRRHGPGRRLQAELDPAQQVARPRTRRPRRSSPPARSAAAGCCAPAGPDPAGPSLTTSSGPGRSPTSAVSASVPNTTSGRRPASRSREPGRAVARPAPPSRTGRR